ncbi:MAG: sigma-70 family RNA polymerase sigma factor [Firmicutes bacterium]|nr:sigma-70 family RNA polymerase sigma factor [Bacillota bacterium]
MEVNISDIQLAYEIKTEPSKGLEKSIELYGGAVKVICRAVLSGYSIEDIEEAISDVFASLWQSIGLYDPKKTRLKSYIYGIARNTANNKKRSVAKEKPHENIDDVSALAFDDTEYEALHSLNTEIMREMIMSLKAPANKVFTYRYFHDMSVENIADCLDIPTKKVQNILFRYKEKLRREFDKRGILV